MNRCLSWIAGLFFAALVLAAPAMEPPAEGTVSQQVARVRVASSGELYLNEQRITPDNLTNELQRLRGTTGAVAFSADTNDVNRILNQQVFEKLVRAGLPVVMKNADGSPRDEGVGTGGLVNIDFKNLPVGDVLNFYAGLAGAKLLKPIGINASVTLSLEDATQGEALKAVELELTRYNISLKRSDDETISIQWKTGW